MSHAHPFPPGTLVRAETVSPLRRSPASPRRQPSRLGWWLRRAGLPLAVLGLPLAAGGWLLTSPRFDLAQVAVAGASAAPGGSEAGAGGRVEAAWVRGQLAPLGGRNLLLLPLAEVEERLLAHPWVGGVAMVKELPNRLTVTVEERRPAARVRRGEGLWWADGEGGLIAAIDAAAGEGAGETAGETAGEGRQLPLVIYPQAAPAATAVSRSRQRLPELPAALATLAELGAAEPAWAAGVTAVKVLGEEDFEIETAALPFPLRLRRGEVGAPSQRLAELLPELQRRYGDAIEVVDLRFSRRIVLQGLALTGEPGRGVGQDG